MTSILPTITSTIDLSVPSRCETPLSSPEARSPCDSIPAAVMAVWAPCISTSTFSCKLVTFTEIVIDNWGSLGLGLAAIRRTITKGSLTLIFANPFSTYIPSISDPGFFNNKSFLHSAAPIILRTPRKVRERKEK